MRVSSVAVLGAALLLTACGQDKAPPPPAAPPPTDAEKAAALAALPAPYNTADLMEGKRQFALCKSCHTITPGGPNLTGPNLYGMFGRRPGMAQGYAYSDAVKNAQFIWDAQHLDKWLADPRGFLPGTKMSFLGVREAQDRINLIAYLKVETGYKAQ